MGFERDPEQMRAIAPRFDDGADQARGVLAAVSNPGGLIDSLRAAARAEEGGTEERSFADKTSAIGAELQPLLTRYANLLEALARHTEAVAKGTEADDDDAATRLRSLLHADG